MRLTDWLRKILPTIEKGLSVENTVHNELAEIQRLISFLEGSPLTIEVPSGK